MRLETRVLKFGGVESRSELKSEGLAEGWCHGERSWGGNTRIAKWQWIRKGMVEKE